MKQTTKLSVIAMLLAASVTAKEGTAECKKWQDVQPLNQVGSPDEEETIQKEKYYEPMPVGGPDELRQPKGKEEYQVLEAPSEDEEMSEEDNAIVEKMGWEAGDKDSFGCPAEQEGTE